MEFKSTARGGTHYIGTNQAANAGAVVSNNVLKLTRNGLGIDSLDCNEPQFFSLTMDQECIRINVHWLSVSTEDGQYSFHLEKLSRYFFDDADGLRAAQCAVKNILDWGQNERLPVICKQLDACGGKIQLERTAAEGVVASV